MNLYFYGLRNDLWLTFSFIVAIVMVMLLIAEIWYYEWRHGQLKWYTLLDMKRVPTCCLRGNQRGIALLQGTVEFRLSDSVDSENSDGMFPDTKKLNRT